MFQILFDSIYFGIVDALTSNGLLGGMMTAIIVVCAFGVYVLVTNARLGEARRHPTQTNVNIPPSLTGLYVILGILAFLLFFGK